MREQFLVDFDEWDFINHGAFGATLRCAAVAAEQWRGYQEAQPLRFFDRVLFPHMALSHHAMAPLLGAPAHDLAFLPNATTGLNAVIQGLTTGKAKAAAAQSPRTAAKSTSIMDTEIGSMDMAVGPGDILLTTNHRYGSVRRMLDVAAERTVRKL